MKMTLEIADDLFERAQRIAKKEKTTLSSLVEQGLRLVLDEKQNKAGERKWEPMFFKGRGCTQRSVVPLKQRG